MGVAIRTSNLALVKLELELEIIQTQMTKKPMLRAEVGMRDLSDHHDVDARIKKASKAFGALRDHFPL